MNLTDIKELKESVRATLFSKALFIIENSEILEILNLLSPRVRLSIISKELSEEPSSTIIASQSV